MCPLFTYTRRMRLPILAVCLLATPALAQVSTNSNALDKLPPAPAAPANAPAAQPRHHPTRRPPAAKPAAKKLTAIGMPALPPAHPVIVPPPIVMPAHPPPPPPPVPMRADATGAASAITGGTRITFGPGTSDLNPATVEAIRGVAAKALASPAETVSITAWAPGPADDPSTARRLSLDRALAARAVMIQAGLLSDRIRAVAEGTTGISAESPDRADIVLGVAGEKK